MRSRPRQFASFSINTGGQSSFWQAFSELQKQHLCTLQLAVCAQVWRKLSLQLLQLADSVILGLDYLLVMVWTIYQLFFGALSLEKGVPPFVWLSSLVFASGMILCQG
jgi:hypothetical protein